MAHWFAERPPRGASCSNIHSDSFPTNHSVPLPGSGWEREGVHRSSCAKGCEDDPAK
ncbi:Two-component system regulator [Anopheles sinensis]|uniref:Two-component system regulator n=1 Tax=Anopheles sinensis TaxID=74873 RepID=A0A084WJP1_ANOSI|nr:Two-component system regulator [Anopheles sinensis]